MPDATRRALDTDAAQIADNLRWIDNSPNEDAESVKRLLDEPGRVTVFDPTSKAVMHGIILPDDVPPGVSVIWWVGPPESHFRDLLVVLKGFVEEVLRLVPEARPWRFYGDTDSGVLANRWVQEVRTPGSRTAIVTTRTSDNNPAYTTGESTIGAVADALGVTTGVR